MRYVACRSMVELTNERIEDSKIDDVVNGLFQRAGLSQKEKVTFAEFQKMTQEFRDDLNLMSLDMQCKCHRQTGDILNSLSVDQSISLNVCDRKTSREQILKQFNTPARCSF